MNRTAMAIVLSPGFTALVLCLVQMARGSTDYFVSFFVFSYYFGLIPSAIAISVLKSSRHTTIWSFALAVFVVALVCTVILVEVAYSGAETPLQFFSKFSELLVVGPLTGMFAWAVSETTILDRIRVLYVNSQDYDG
jgi:hypothetical protein